MVIAWKSLKSITLEHTVLHDDHIVILLFGCPALETMELDTVEGFRRLEIKSLKLKRLNIGFLVMEMIIPWKLLPPIFNIWRFQEIFIISCVGLSMCLP